MMYGVYEPDNNGGYIQILESHGFAPYSPPTGSLEVVQHPHRDAIERIFWYQDEKEFLDSLIGNATPMHAVYLRPYTGSDSHLNDKFIEKFIKRCEKYPPGAKKIEGYGVFRETIKQYLQFRKL